MEQQLLTHTANSVLDQETRKQLSYEQLRNHQKCQETWNKYVSNEMGRSFQGVGTGKNGIGKGVEGTNTFYVIKFEDIPKYRLNEICYTSVVCEVIPGKKYPNRTKSQYVEHMYATQGMSAPTQPHWNSSNL